MQKRTVEVGVKYAEEGSDGEDEGEEEDDSDG